MKHSVPITAALVVLFVVAQIVGLVVTNQHVPHLTETETGEVEVVNATGELAFDTQRPETASALQTFLYIASAIVIGTILMLILIRYNQRIFIKGWFYLAIVLCITYSLASFNFISDTIALIIGIVFAYFKIIRPNVIIHNISEVLIYGALGALFVPMQYMNIYVGILLLAAISLYDAYAVWKSKHMVKLATFQTDMKIFAGLMIPKDKKGLVPRRKDNKKHRGKGHAQGTKKSQTAILGGGDIAFPLLFTGIVMKELMMQYPQALAFGLSLIITATSAIALTILFVKAEKGKFYPAMPFISAGCIVGFLIVSGLVYLL